jgi:F-type H+-transporting ATPase subunit c
VVERPAHDGFVVGSIPTWLILIMHPLLGSAKFIGSGLATIGLVGAGVGIGIIFGAFLMAYSRNPQLKDDLFKYAILGFALTEAIALFALMMAFLILYS